MSRLRAHEHDEMAPRLLAGELRAHLVDSHGYADADLVAIADDDLDGEHDWAHSDE